MVIPELVEVDRALKGLYVSGDRIFEALQVKNNQIVTLINRLKNSKTYSLYSDLEFELNFFDNMIAEEFNKVANRRILAEESRAELKTTKEGLLPEYRKKEGVTSLDVARSLIEKDYEDETGEVEAMLKKVEIEQLEISMRDRYLKSAIRIANHLKDYFFREEQQVKRTSLGTE